MPAFWRGGDEASDAEAEARFSYLSSAPAADEQGERRVIPKVMTGAALGMVVFTIALTVFAGPLYEVCERIGGALLQPISLIQLEDVEKTT